METKDAIKRLLADVEAKLGRQLRSPSDFSEFIMRLEREGNCGTMSMSTLKRMWGYVQGYKTVRANTLSVLARFIGFHDWQDYMKMLDDTESSEWHVQPALPLSDLTEGDRVELRWHPCRRVVVRYLGCGEFVVEDSDKAKLHVGDRFTCGGIVCGERLVLTQVMRGTDALGTYVCGKSGGVRAKVLPPSPS